MYLHKNFIQNKYTKWYFNIIKNAKSRTMPRSETEHHHILPRSIYPEYENLKENPWNGIYLTFREHLLCHWMLFKMTEGKHKSKMFYSMVRFFNGKPTHYNILPSRIYEQLKREYRTHHWSNFKTDKEIATIYKKRGNQTDNFAGQQKWWAALTDVERKEFHSKQAKKRCRGWWISTLDNPNTETFVLNLREWCDNLGVDTSWASNIANLNSKSYGGSLKGYRIRKDGNPKLPLYIDKRKLSKPNPFTKGRTWKVVDNKRVWMDK